LNSIDLIVTFPFDSGSVSLPADRKWEFLDFEMDFMPVLESIICNQTSILVNSIDVIGSVLCDEAVQDHELESIQIDFESIFLPIILLTICPQPLNSIDLIEPIPFGIDIHDSELNQAILNPHEFEQDIDEFIEDFYSIVFIHSFQIICDHIDFHDYSISSLSNSSRISPIIDFENILISTLLSSISYHQSNILNSIDLIYPISYSYSYSSPSSISSSFPEYSLPLIIYSPPSICQSVEYALPLQYSQFVEEIFMNDFSSFFIIDFRFGLLDGHRIDYSIPSSIITFLSQISDDSLLNSSLSTTSSISNISIPQQKHRPILDSLISSSFSPDFSHYELPSVISLTFESFLTSFYEESIIMTFLTPVLLLPLSPVSSRPPLPVSPYSLPPVLSSSFDSVLVSVSHGCVLSHLVD
jgi:hypothetical protein